MEIEDRIVDGMRESLVLASRVSEILFLHFRQRKNTILVILDHFKTVYFTPN